MSSSNSRNTKWAPKCPCGSGDMKLFTSHTETNPNQKFWRCPYWNDDNGCDAFFWKDQVSREHPPNSSLKKGNENLTSTIEGVKDALEAQNRLMCAHIESEDLRNMYLYKIHQSFAVICHVLMIMCCILVYITYQSRCK
eukprot:TRINITY_DN2357_c1_g1_i7.p1 TRINITY_DN2357_c1_g1~~TRINITY_DN2357_c1_g1_i7.p1  ORF type:complete len:139 (+),score=11.33 TRINITY_DN2357_c1_g1_i7:96-512(+)